MKKNNLIYLAMAFMAFFVSCEKGYQGEMELTPEESTAPTTVENTITLRVTGFEKMPFSDNVVSSRSTDDISAVCKRLHFVIFKDDTKVKTVSQTSGDESFGSASLSLEDGTYQLVVIAHNGTGAATLTKPDKITFPNNIVTDTFYYYGELSVTGQSETVDIVLKRAVAMVRFVINDAMPTDVAQMKFYYTGGSSTFNAQTGFGCVNSRQTVTFDVTSDMVGQPSQFEVYTMPHEQTGVLKLTVSALNAQGTVLYEREFAEVDVERNMVTQYTGNFFSKLSSGQLCSVKVDDEWQGQTNVQY